MPNSAAALIAALAMIAGGCVRLDAIYRIISWKTVVLVAGTLPLATALTKTGATEMMANELVAMLGVAWPVGDAGGRVSGHCAGRAVYFQLARRRF